MKNKIGKYYDSTTLINTKYGALVSMVVVKIDEGIDGVEWWTLQYCVISKEVDGGGISNGEVPGKFLTGDIVESKVKM